MTLPAILAVIAVVALVLGYGWLALVLLAAAVIAAVL